MNIAIERGVNFLMSIVSALALADKTRTRTQTEDLVKVSFIGPVTPGLENRLAIFLRGEARPDKESSVLPLFSPERCRHEPKFDGSPHFRWFLAITLFSSV
jgi:hypothetical protein